MAYTFFMFAKRFEVLDPYDERRVASLLLVGVGHYQRAREATPELEESNTGNCVEVPAFTPVILHQTE